MFENRGLNVTLIAGCCSFVLFSLPQPFTENLESAAVDVLNSADRAVLLVKSELSGLIAPRQIIREKETELTRLRLELTECRSKLNSASHYAQENAYLKRLLKQSADTGYEYVYCGVIRRSGISGWQHRMTLDKGADDGLFQDCVVIGPGGGLVGRTVSVTAHSTEVLLTTDPSCRLPCYTEGNTTFGTSCGTGIRIGGRPGLTVVYDRSGYPGEYDISEKTILESGNRVFTSGSDDLYPPGLLLGRLRTITESDAGLPRSALVVPVSDPLHLSYVAVAVDPLPQKKRTGNPRREIVSSSAGRHTNGSG